MSLFFLPETRCFYGEQTFRIQVKDFFLRVVLGTDVQLGGVSHQIIRNTRLAVISFIIQLFVSHFTYLFDVNERTPYGFNFMMFQPRS